MDLCMCCSKKDYCLGTGLGVKKLDISTCCSSFHSPCENSKEDFSCYDGTKMIGDSKMTCILGWRRDNTVIFASDSFNSLISNEVRTNYAKIFPFKKEKCLIAVAGSTNFDWKLKPGEEIGEIIKEYILNLDVSKGDVVYDALNSLCRKLQYTMYGNDITQILVATPLSLTNYNGTFLSNFIDVRCFTLSKAEIREEVVSKENNLFSLGINNVPLDSALLRKKVWDNPKETLKEIIQKNIEIEELISNPPRIGGKVQMFQINSDGNIFNLSDL